MPRRPRLVIPGIPLHIVQRGIDRAPCFFEAGDRLVYLDELHELTRELGCALHAYVLMTNHVHLLLTPRTAEGPARLMNRLGRRYVGALNAGYARTGTLWEGRYRSCIAQDEVYVLACYRYIELNPVRAGVAAHPRDHVWSSYHANAEGIRDRLITPHEQYLRLGGDGLLRRTAYRALVAEAVGEDVTREIRAATHGNTPLGNDRFRAQIEAMLGRRVTPGRRGRPRRSKGETIDGS